MTPRVTVLQTVFNISNFLYYYIINYNILYYIIYYKSFLTYMFYLNYHPTPAPLKADGVPSTGFFKIVNSYTLYLSLKNFPRLAIVAGPEGPLQPPSSTYTTYSVYHCWFML